MMHLLRNKSLPLLVVFFTFPLCSCLGQKEEYFEDSILKIMEKYQCVGISAVVVKHNKICYTRTFGYNPDYKDATLRKPIPSDGIYFIASISKTFVSTAIMQLVEKKKVNLDDDVNKYLSFNVRNPKFPDIPITIRMLLSHRSSLNDKHYALDLNQINPQLGNKFRECYNNYAPGKRFSYCNLGYSLLGAIIENVTGEKFYQYIDDNIMIPLGLNASYNLTKIDPSLLVRSLYYNQKQNKFKKQITIYNYDYYYEKLKHYQPESTVASFSPTGGVKISAKDLAKYMLMHMNNGTYNGKNIISYESEMEMRKVPKGNRNYALAMAHYYDMIEGVEMLGMSGGAHGIHSGMYFNPKEKYGFVVICNGCTSKSSIGKDLNWEIINILYSNIVNSK